MHRLFGRAKEAPAAPAAAPAPDLGEHIKSLEDKIPDLDAKIAQCDRDLAALKAQMARCRTPAQQAPFKQRALGVLKRKNMYVKQREGLQTRAFNLEATSFALDGMKEARTHMEVMKGGVAAMREGMKEFDIGDVEDVMDDMADAMADADEINEVLGRSYDTYNDVNEADLDAQLAALDDDIAAGVLDGAAAAPAGVGVDDVPSYLPAAAAPIAAGGAGGGGGGGGGGGTGARVPAYAFPSVPAATALPAIAAPAGMGTPARF